MQNTTSKNLLKSGLRALTTALLFSIMFVPGTVNAQEDASGIDLELAIVSNYVFRGEDLFTSKAAQDEKVPGAHTGAPAFQPSITFNMPTEGFYFNLWTSYAMTNRADKDVDGNGYKGNDCEFNSDAGEFDSAPDGEECEQNGLARYDEVDYTFGYESEGRIGTVGFGIVAYTYPSSQTDGSSETELFFDYSPSNDMLSGLYIHLVTSINQDIDEYQYYQFGYAYDFEISNDIAVNFDIAAGYQTQFEASGWRDVTASLGVSTLGFSVSYNITQRITNEFFDYDDDEADFKVEDPGTGELKELPRNLWWVYVGYEVSF